MCNARKKPGSAPRGVLRRIVKAAKKGTLKSSPLEFALGLLEVLREKDLEKLEKFEARIGKVAFLQFMEEMQRGVAAIAAEQKRAKRAKRAA